jgi:hypothetical protein
LEDMAFRHRCKHGLPKQAVRRGQHGRTGSRDREAGSRVPLRAPMGASAHCGKADRHEQHDLVGRGRLDPIHGAGLHGGLPRPWRCQGSMPLPCESLRRDDDVDDSPRHHRRTDHRDGWGEPPSALFPATRGPKVLQAVAAAHVVLLHQGPTGSGASPSTPSEPTSGISQQLRCQVTTQLSKYRRWCCCQ